MSIEQQNLIERDIRKKLVDSKSYRPVIMSECADFFFLKLMMII
jgi:hypothetical protein